MPLSHLTLTVSHLPTSTSFFLSCLQPLGYCFIGRYDNSVGFGSEPGQPADFWLSEERPGVPPGAAHVAFPAPSRDAVRAFFVAALKAGGKIHGEPCLRDSEQNYFSAAVIDFDGNSVEAVHRPGSSHGKSRPGDRALTVIENGSVVSKASSVKSRSVAREKAPASEAGSVKAPSTVHGHRSAQVVESQPKPTTRDHPISSPQVHIQAKENGENGGKTVVGTLIGAAAGAAIAYAMCKGESQSNQTSTPQYVESAPAPSPMAHGAPEFRAIEAVPADGGMSDYTRNALSKNPKASTIFEGLEQCSRFLGGQSASGSVRNGGEEHHFQEARRHSTTGSITYSAGSEMNIPIRAIEGIYPDDNGSDCSCMYADNQGTLISSFVDRSRYRDSDAGSMHSSSTVKPSKQASSRHSHSSRSHVDHSKRSCTGGGGTPPASVYSATHSARNVPLPPGSSTTTSGRSRRHSHSPSHHSHRDNSSSRSNHSRHHHRTAGSTASSHKTIKSFRSAHDIPIPMPTTVLDGEANTMIFGGGGGGGVGLDDFDSYVISPEGASRASRSKSKASSPSHRSSHHSSHRRPESSGGRSKKSSASKSSSKLDEPVRPSDSVSQVSTNASKKSGKSRR